MDAPVPAAILPPFSIDVAGGVVGGAKFVVPGVRRHIQWTTVYTTHELAVCTKHGYCLNIYTWWKGGLVQENLCMGICVLVAWVL